MPISLSDFAPIQHLFPHKKDLEIKERPGLSLVVDQKEYKDLDRRTDRIR